MTDPLHSLAQRMARTEERLNDVERWRAGIDGKLAEISTDVHVMKSNLGRIADAVTASNGFFERLTKALDTLSGRIGAQESIVKALVDTNEVVVSAVKRFIPKQLSAETPT